MAKICLHDGCQSQVFAGGYCKFHQHMTEKSINRMKKNREGVHNGSFKQAVKKQNKEIQKKIYLATAKPRDGKLLRLIERCDYLFSKYIRQLADRDHGKIECYTCGKKEHWKLMQAGHYIPRRYYQFRWDYANVKIQCSDCNCMKDGNLVPFSIKLIKEDAVKFEEMIKRKHEVFKITHGYLLDLSKELTTKLIEKGFEFNPKM